VLTVLYSLNHRFAAWSLAVGSMTCMSANAGLLPERVEKAAQERIETGTYQTLVFGVVEDDKSEVAAFGKLDDGKVPDGDTVYEIASVTKTFTGMLLAKAVLAGRVTLDTPVAQLLPDFKIPSRGGKGMTLGHLATHHSGLPQEASGDYTAAKLKAFLAAYELPRDPGASYEYSNLGFALLGYALARLEHTTYSALVGREILDPLGMTMSGALGKEAMRGHVAAGHDYAGNAANQPDVDALVGAGAIRSTANDMLRYLKANMGMDRSPLAAAMKLAQQPRRDMGKAERVGLAWMTTDKGIVWHNGLNAGQRSFLGFTSDGRRGVVILANTAVDADDLGFATLDADAPLLEDYEGNYKLADKSMLMVFRINDGLFARATGQDAFPVYPSAPFPLYPSAPYEVFDKLFGISISFTRDSKGVVRGLILHQNGDRVAPKLSPSEVPAKFREIVLDAATLVDYIGKYRLDFGAVVDFALKGDRLETQITGQPAFQVYASAKDKFFLKIIDAQFDFERDAGGKVNAVVLHQNGRDIRASRMPTER
jgi:serine-type D-Ala-D-Ala carboxypeptidase/endopeptidase